MNFQHLSHLQEANENNLLLVMEVLEACDVFDAAVLPESRRWPIRPVNKKRKELGYFYHFHKELKTFDDELFYQFYRMTYAQFDNLVRILGPTLQKKSIRESISPEERIVLCLRFLASGDSVSTLNSLFRIGETTIRSIVKEVCQVIQAVLGPLHLKTPVTEEEWKDVARGFEAKHKFPHVIGCLDGKHIEIQAPPCSGTTFFNYKKTYSVVLLALCDADYRFIYVHTGSYGSESDGGIFSRSCLGQALEASTLNLPPAEPLSESFPEPIPYFFLGDEAFPKKKYLMTPYSGRGSGQYLADDKYLYNLEHARCRRIIENTFGIYATKWRVFLNKITCFPEFVDEIVGATIMLHNYLINSSCNRYLNQNTLNAHACHDQGDEQSQWHRLPPTMRFGARNATEEVIKIRDYVKDYIYSGNNQ